MKKKIIDTKYSWWCQEKLTKTENNKKKGEINC